MSMERSTFLSRASLRALSASGLRVSILGLMGVWSTLAHAQPPARGSPAYAVTWAHSAVEAGAPSQAGDGYGYERAEGEVATFDARGTPLSVTPLGHWDAEQVTEYLEDFALDASQVRCGVDAYRVVYRTIDTAGAPTIASSLLAAPRCAEASAGKQVVWLHGTTLYKRDAASISEDSDDRATAFAFAAAGFVTTAPDYLGLGVSPGTHPYDDRPSEVTASIDALRATRTLAHWFGQRLDPRIAVSGFSQGAAASMALARALQEGGDPHLQLGALAPMSGPYDMSGSLAAAMSGDIAFAPAYVAYLTVAWNRLHHLYDSPSEAFLPPYDQTIEASFDNTHPPDEVLPTLPQTVEALFTPQFLDLLRHPSGNLRAALEVADSVCDFRPLVTAHLFAGSADRDTPIANAFTCLEKLESHGASVDLTNLGDLDHSASLAPALTRAIELFGSDARALIGVGGAAGTYSRPYGERPRARTLSFGALRGAALRDA